MTDFRCESGSKKSVKMILARNFYGCSFYLPPRGKAMRPFHHLVFYNLMERKVLSQFQTIFSYREETMAQALNITFCDIFEHYSMLIIANHGSLLRHRSCFYTTPRNSYSFNFKIDGGLAGTPVCLASPLVQTVSPVGHRRHHRKKLRQRQLLRTVTANYDIVGTLGHKHTK